MRYNCTVTAMRRLRISYNNSLRRLLGIPKHNSASEMLCSLTLNHLVNCFINRLQCSNDLILSSICESTVPIYSNILTLGYDLLIP